MKTSRSQIGLSIIAGGLSFVGSAQAVDIVIDGSYESSTNNMVSSIIGNGGNDAGGIDGGWTHFSSYTYAAGFTQAGPVGSGLVYLRPYNDTGGSMVVMQTNSLTRAITTGQIDGAQGQYTFSAWFSTYHGQNDYSDLTLQFLDSSFNQVGSTVAIGGAAFVAGLAGGNGNRKWGQDTKIGLVPPTARYAAITSTSHALVNLPDGYVDLVSLVVVAGSVPVQISGSPPNDATGVSPNVVVKVTLSDGTSALNTNSIQFKYDGGTVVPTITKTGATTTIQYDPPGLLPSLSVHTYQVAFNNTGGATPNTTNQFAFTVAPWININLGAPIQLETFDSVSEGALPSGWSVTNATDSSSSGFNLNNWLSDSYLDWVVISRTRLINSLMAGSADFFGVTNIAPNQVINGSVVSNLISGNFIFANSDRVDGQKQIQTLFTRDYNLSGRTNVYLSFHNSYVQNQDNLGAVEYSINGGATWLPALYLLDEPDILRDANGNIDASNTFATRYGDVPDAPAGVAVNGYYGEYIGVNSNLWADLAPYIAARVDDDETEGKRVEVIRLAQADNQPAVRVRFEMAGAYSWYFGVDDFGLYSLTNQGVPVLTGNPTPAALTVAVGNGANLTISDALGLGPLTYQWRRNGVNLPGRTSQVLGLPNVQTSDAGSYDVVISNGSGSVTSAAPSVITVINPNVFVTGQWDFPSNLTATCGLDLQYFDGTVASDTSFGTTTSFGISDINGQPTTIMHFFPTALAWGGYKLFPNTGPNGGGTNINQYTLIYDVYYSGNVFSTWRSLWQTDPDNATDGDVFLNPGNGVGIGGIYNGFVSADTWHRIAFAFDLSGPGEAPVLTKFIDGVKVGNQTAALSAVDDRFSVKNFGLLFADQDGDIHEAYVSSVQFSNGRRPDAFLAALGGPSAAKIPGCITARLQAGQVVIRWTGGVPLQGADDITGPWSTVNGATSPYTVPSIGAKKFYRPKIP